MVRNDASMLLKDGFEYLDFTSTFSGSASLNEFLYVDGTPAAPSTTYVILSYV